MGEVIMSEVIKGILFVMMMAVVVAVVIGALAALAPPPVTSGVVSGRHAVYRLVVTNEGGRSETHTVTREEFDAVKQGDFWQVKE